MAVQASYVGIAVDGPGKKVDNVHVTTAVGEVERQVTVTGDPEDAAARQKITAALPAADAYGAATREVAPGFDSGLTAVPDVSTVITADTIRAIGILLCSLTDAGAAVSLTNSAGGFYLNQFPLQGRMTVFVPLGRATMVGAKWQSGVAGAVNAQLIGEK